MTVGGFDSYSYQIRVTVGYLSLEASTLDRLQSALLDGAPHWSSIARVSRLGASTITARFDASIPGSLFRVLEAHRPGGPRAKPTTTRSMDREVRLTGADRGASVTFEIAGAMTSGAPASIGDLFVETTKREIDGIPAGAWVKRLFRSLCSEMAPRRAVASSFGERRGSDRHALSGRTEWLTYLGAEAASRVDEGTLRAIEGVLVEEVSGGLLIQIDPDPGPRRRIPYWRKLKAVDDVIGWVRNDAAPLRAPSRRSPA